MEIPATGAPHKTRLKKKVVFYFLSGAKLSRFLKPGKFLVAETEWSICCVAGRLFLYVVR